MVNQNFSQNGDFILIDIGTHSCGEIKSFTNSKFFFFKLAKRIIKNLYKKKSINLNAKQLKKYDCVIVITNHDKIDYKLIHKNTNLIFDCRSVFKKSKKVIQV